MRTGELPEIAPRPADHSQDLSVKGNFEDAPWVGRLPDEQYLIRTGSNANRVRCPNDSLEAFAGRCSAIRSARRRIRRHIDFKHALEVAVRIKDLDTMVRAVADINIILKVDGDRVGQIELAGPAALRSP